MPDYWIYSETDEAGTVQPGDTPHEALKAALECGFDPDGAEVYAVELGKMTCFGVLEEDDLPPD